MLRSSGWTTMVAGEASRNVAGAEVTLPCPLLTTQRNWSPFIEAVIASTVRIADWAPEKLPPLNTLTQLLEPAGKRCHWKVNGGDPVTPTSNVAAPEPSCTKSWGCEVIAG